MAPLPYTSSQSGPRVTVNDWIQDPKRIPTYILSLMNQGFLADALLRPAGDAPGGVVAFSETTPIYADGTGTIANRAEGAEVPIASGSLGTPNVVYSQDKALRVLVTAEMRRRNKIEVLNTRVTQVVNSIIRAFDDLFVQAVLSNAGILTQAASAVWTTTSTDIRGDILAAAEQIEGALDGQGSELEYKPDTLLVNRATKFDIINSTQFNSVYLNAGDLASENLKYTGVLPKKILDYDVVFTPRVPAGTAILLQRGQCGFIADEVPLKSYDMIEDRNRLSWSGITQRVSAVGIDQPKAIAKITGV